MKKTKESFLKEYKACYTDYDVLKKLRPMTLEGCVVRISDMIGYIGRDIEDAIEIGVISREDIPDNIKQVLGVTNTSIVNTLIRDIIEHSLNKPYIAMSKEVYQALFDLKEFNYKNIYRKANSKERLEFYRSSMEKLYKKCLDDLNQNNLDSDIYQVYLKNANPEYIKNTNNKRIVLDYIAGMTDEYFLELSSKIEC